MPEVPDMPEDPHMPEDPDMPIDSNVAKAPDMLIDPNMAEAPDMTEDLAMTEALAKSKSDFRYLGVNSEGFDLRGMLELGCNISERKFVTVLIIPLT